MPCCRLARSPAHVPPPRTASRMRTLRESHVLRSRQGVGGGAFAILPSLVATAKCLAAWVRASSPQHAAAVQATSAKEGFRERSTQGVEGPGGGLVNRQGRRRDLVSGHPCVYRAKVTSRAPGPPIGRGYQPVWEPGDTAKEASGARGCPSISSASRPAAGEREAPTAGPGDGRSGRFEGGLAVWPRHRCLARMKGAG